jgi:hypothetical protein
MGCLLLWDWFDTILITCLPVGHTHDQIDSLFSHPRSHYLKHGMLLPTEVSISFFNIHFLSLKLIMKKYGLQIQLGNPKYILFLGFMILSRC